MADKANLRNMVLTFRVSELQLLLGLTSQSRCGRKTELMQRALALVERGVSTQVQLKIHELYQRFTPRSAGYSPPPAHRSMASSSSSSLTKAPAMLPSQHATMSSAATASRPNGVHRGLSELLIQQQRSQIPNHPDVKYKHLPFYDVLGEIMRPTSLVPRGSAKQQEARLNFCLNEQQVRDIGMSSRDSTSPDRVDFVVQVQLRFCLLDSTSRQPDVFPSNISVKVNGMPAPLPNPIPTNKPGMEPKRPSRPVDITRICRLSASVSNGMVITWNADASKNHCVAVYLVKRLDSNQLLQRLKRSGTLKVENTKQMVKEKLSLDMDTDLATTSMRVSLLCPLGKMRMSLPCRASTCNHLQCFDGPTFLQMNEKKPTWMCPVCDRPAEFNRLVIDGLFTEIIRASVDSTEIELSKDGQWHVTKTDDSDDESPCNSPNPTKSSSHAVTASTTSGEEKTEKTEGAAAIDLTETDDEGIEQSASNSRCASATTASYTPGGTISSPRSNSPAIATHDLSPLNIPMPTPPPPPLPSASPASSSRGTVSPPPLPPLPPMAHQSYPTSKLPNIPPPPLPPNFNGAPAAAHSSGSARAMPYSRLPSTSYSAGRRGGVPAGAYDDRRVQPDMMDFLSIVNGMSDYAVTPQYSLPSNAFDYLYAPQRRDTDLERSKGRGSPTTSS